MNSRFTLFLGPALVLYLLADVASRGGLWGAGYAAASGSVLLSLMPWWLATVPRMAARGRVQVLAMAAALVLVRLADTHGASIMALVLANGALSVVGGVVMDLAITAPHPADRPRRRWFARVLSAAVVVVGVILGVRHPTGVVLASPAMLTFAFAMTVAFTLRLIPAVVGRGPDASAANTWTLLGLGAALLLNGVVAGLVRLGWLPSSAMAPALGAGLGAVALGHGAMLLPEYRASASPVVRGVVTLALILTAVILPLRAAVEGGVATGLLPWLAAAAVVFAFLLREALAPVVFRALAPFGGRLLDAIAEVRRHVAASGTFDGLARRVLVPLRRASADLDAEPVLYTTVPAREVRIDAAGEPRVRMAPMPESIRAYLLDHPSEIIVRDDLAQHVVRRPEVRALVETLTVEEALCVVPLVVEGELEGALLVPQGQRTTPLRMEELRALAGMAAEVASMTSVLAAHVRAEDRIAVAKRERDRLEESLELMRLAHLRSEEQVRMLSLAGADPDGADVFVHYSSLMRETVATLHRYASEDVPVVMVGEEGTGAAHLAQYLHGKSPRAAAPFVLGDCGRVRSEDAMAQVFGDGHRPGWLALASGGTLFLRDVLALPLEVQGALVLALSEKRAATVGSSAASYDVDVRVVVSSRLPLAGPVALGVFNEELGRWLARAVVTVPALRDRPEDVPSLVLLALDRATRVMGRGAVGMEPEALAVLREYAWPGNLPEVTEVVTAAVRAATGSRVTVADIPVHVRTGKVSAAHPLEGTYDELEQRILEHALARAGGNKSEAARLLGLKRTTFLDKLQRYGEGATPDSVEPS